MKVDKDRVMLTLITAIKNILIENKIIHLKKFWILVFGHPLLRFPPFLLNELLRRTKIGLH